MRTNKFITFEGVDGSGKTSLIRAMAKYLEDQGNRVIAVREPGSSNIGELVREMLFNDKPGVKNMYLGQADCLLLADHIGVAEGIVRPNIERGYWVLCDRYADSQFAYMVAKDSSPAVNSAYRQHFGPVPDVTFLLVGDVEVFHSRAKSRDIAPDAAEPGKQQRKAWNSVEAQKEIQDAYVARLADEPRTILLNIDGMDSEAVANAAIYALKQRLSSMEFIASVRTAHQATA